MTKYSTSYLVAAYALFGAAVVFSALALPIMAVTHAVSRSKS
jgi:hypothetical protein